MKTIKTNQITGLSYYEQYLLSYLKDSHPDKSTDIKFITQRADQASETFELSRLEGNTVEVAQEEAMATLTKGLHFSLYDTIIEVLWNEFIDIVPPADAPRVALLILSAYQPQNNYLFDDDFADTPEYHELYSELTGVITLKFEEYGI